MGSDIFEVGLFKPDAGENNAVMLPRVWDTDALLRSIAWLRHQNHEGRNIYIRPKGEHALSLVDDLNLDALGAMKCAGFAPALVVETSPGNFQAWLKHPEKLSKELGTAAARALARRFGGDLGAADWRHFGRLAGFTNRKPVYRDDATGLFPFVKLIESPGSTYPESARFLREICKMAEQKRAPRIQTRAEPAQQAAGIRSIESFRTDPRYEGDGTRIDLAYAIYAFSRGLNAAQIEAAIKSRDLSHKGGERRQSDYVARTVRKALEYSGSRGRGR